MSFSSDVKEEVLSLEMNKKEAEVFIVGLASAAGVILGTSVTLQFNRHEISSEIRELLRQLKIIFSHNSKNRNWINISLKGLETKNILLPSSYFAGVFVGGGSISKLESTSYHLELQFHHKLNADKVKNFLNKYSFEFHSITRGNKWVLYIKKAEQISDFLKAIRAMRCMLKFEEVRIERDFSNQLNRMSNLDVYNSQKLSYASKRHIGNWNYVINHGLEDYFKENEIIFFKMKKNDPHSSLSELATKMFNEHNIYKTRSGLNHWLRKLAKIVEEN